MNAKTPEQLDVEIAKTPLVVFSRLISMDEAKRQMTHVVSTAKLDRANRIVDVGGWQLANFRKNPVVLANHDYEIGSIIGQSAHVGPNPDGTELQATTQFADDGLGATAFKLAQAGLARAWSAGWNPIDAHRLGENPDCPVCAKFAGKDTYGRHFTKQDLLEYSLVAVPANPQAVMGLDHAGLSFTADEIEAWNHAMAPETPAKPAGTTGGSKVEEVAPANATVDTEVEDDRRVDPPVRSPEFYAKLFDVARNVGRRRAAVQMKQRFGRRT